MTHSLEYNDGYGDGYRSGVRDAQIELRNALGNLDGARLITIHGYDDDYDVDSGGTAQALLVKALSDGLASPRQSRLVAIDGELDLDELASFVLARLAPSQATGSGWPR